MDSWYNIAATAGDATEDWASVAPDAPSDAKMAGLLSNPKVAFAGTAADAVTKIYKQEWLSFFRQPWLAFISGAEQTKHLLIRTSAYDENGNILGMYQKCLAVNTGQIIDKLTYDYGSTNPANQLLGVTDSLTGNDLLLVRLYL